MGQIDDMEAKLDWCVEALKHLLAREVDWWNVPIGLADLDGEIPKVNPDLPAPHIGVAVELPDEVRVTNGRPPKEKPGCPHQHQTIVEGAVTCAKCGFVIVQGGIVGDAARNGDRAIRTEWGQNSLAESNI